MSEPTKAPSWRRTLRVDRCELRAESGVRVAVVRRGGTGCFIMIRDYADKTSFDMFRPHIDEVISFAALEENPWPVAIDAACRLAHRVYPEPGGRQVDTVNAIYHAIMEVWGGGFNAGVDSEGFG